MPTKKQPVKLVTPITANKVSLVEASLPMPRCVDVPEGVTLKDCLNPKYWVHAATMFKVRGEVTLWAENNAWRAKCVVVAQNRTELHLRELEFIQLEATDRVYQKDGLYVKWNGPHDLYCVFTDDGHKIIRGCKDKEAARTELERELIKAA